MLLTGNAVFDNIVDIQPHSVAVAYFGKSWRSLLGNRLPRRLLVAPILGSDPKAILAAMKELGAENVAFLDKLHAKVFIGDRECVLGSANLSDNAANHLREACIRSNSTELMQQLAIWFDQLVEQSKSTYPDVRTKLDRLDMLERETDLARRSKTTAKQSGVGKGGDSVPSLRSYLTLREGDALNNLHITYYQYLGEVKLRSEVIAEYFPGVECYSCFSDYISFVESDSRLVKQGHWILVWHAKKNGFPSKNAKSEPYWLFVDQVIPRGVIDDTYTLLAGESSESVSLGKVPPHPFKLDEPTVRALAEALSEERYSAFRPNDGDWSLRRGAVRTKNPRCRQRLAAV